MLENLHIKNFKSIADESIDLGRINVFIGENGSGKSNILEALMIASLAETYGTVDADILYTNGVRVSKPSLMVNGFEHIKNNKNIGITLEYENEVEIQCVVTPQNPESINTKWENVTDSDSDFMNGLLNSQYLEKDDYDSMLEEWNSLENLNKEGTSKGDAIINNFKRIEEFGGFEKIMKLYFHKIQLESKKYYNNRESFKKSKEFENLSNFIIYTLNTEALRGIPEFQKTRKGIYGETLDKIIASLNEAELEELKEHTYGKIEWLDDFFIDEKDELKRDGYKMNNSQSLLYFKDKHMASEGNNNLFSAENSNEGILHLLFYLANIISTKTSKLFAIDNIETALNPRLCEHTMEEICTLAKKHDKQILITTHNPAILDGLNLLDDEIRLFEVFRLDNGETKTRRIEMKPEVEGEKYKLSELWTRGYLGAISDRY